MTKNKKYEIVHKIEGFENSSIVNDYNELFNSTWTDQEEIQDLLKSEYFNNLIHYMNQKLISPEWVYPKMLKTAFRAFRNIDFNDIKVVIFDDCPEAHYLANGIAFGVNDGMGPIPSKSSDNFRELISNHRDLQEAKTFTYQEIDYGPFQVDTGLEHIADNDVLMLNTSLLSTSGSGGVKISYERIFREFTRKIISTIDNYKMHVLFVFTNKEQERHFKKEISLKYNATMTVDMKTTTSLIEDINNHLKNCNIGKIDW